MYLTSLSLMKKKFPPISTVAARKQAMKDIKEDLQSSTYPLMNEKLICQGNPNGNIIPIGILSYN